MGRRNAQELSEVFFLRCLRLIFFRTQRVVFLKRLQPHRHPKNNDHAGKNPGQRHVPELLEPIRSNPSHDGSGDAGRQRDFPSDETVAVIFQARRECGKDDGRERCRDGGLLTHFQKENERGHHDHAAADTAKGRDDAANGTDENGDECIHATS